MSRHVGKLVRDGIPDIIEAGGGRAIVRVLDQDEYIEALHDKLSEEVEEFRASGEVEELADILEVIYALAETALMDRAGLEAIRSAKAQARGGFHDRIFLIETHKR